MTTNCTSTVLVCRGCCCGTDKQAGVDHDAQLSALRAAVVADPSARLRTTNCLGPCGLANVMAVRHRDPAQRGRRLGTTWLGEVLSPDATAALAAWVAGGADPTALPSMLAAHVFDPAEVTGGVTSDTELTFHHDQPTVLGDSVPDAATTPTTAHSPFERAAAAVVAVDRGLLADAAAYSDRLTKPRGALGTLEGLGARLCAMAGEVPPTIPEPACVVVFAGDHGVHAAGVTPWPQDVTAQMVANFVAGGAAINAFARQVGATVTVVDVGVAADLSIVLEGSPTLRLMNVAHGTKNLMVEPAMTAQQFAAALDVGATVAADLVEQGTRLLVTGDMGIANTTPSAAIIAAFTGRTAAEITGRGTGIDDNTLVHKTSVVAAALARVAGQTDPRVLAAELGGLEIAAIAGLIVGGAAARVPVIIDGVIALAGLCVAHALAPLVLDYVVAGHRSTEPGASAALAHLGLDPLLDLGLRLGEGTGACLAIPLVQAAARVLAEMATFDGAGVSEKQR